MIILEYMGFLPVRTNEVVYITGTLYCNLKLLEISYLRYIYMVIDAHQ